MTTADIGQSLFMSSSPEHPAEFNNVDLLVAKIAGLINLNGAVLSTLDLTGTTIDGALFLAQPSLSPQWRDGGRLVLRNASVDAIGDTAADDVWPAQLELDGFIYRRLG